MATLKNKPGSTPFHLAVQNTGRGGSGAQAARAAQREIIQGFLSFGLSPALKDGKGKSVFGLGQEQLDTRYAFWEMRRNPVEEVARDQVQTPLGFIRIAKLFTPAYFMMAMAYDLRTALGWSRSSTCARDERLDRAIVNWEGGDPISSVLCREVARD